MANVIKHKRGSGSDPVASDLVVGEVAIRTDVGKLFTKMDNGTVAEIAGGGSDIAINTLSSSSGTGGGSATFNGSAYRFTLSAPPSVSAQQLLVSINGVIQKPVAGTGQPSEGFSVDGTDIILGDAPATGSDFFILTFKSLGVSEPADNSVTSAKIVDGAIVNADINASAAIDVSKLSGVLPSAGGTLTGDLTISNSFPKLTFTDSDNNPDFQINVQSGFFTIKDVTNNDSRIYIEPSGTINLANNVNALAGVDVTGNITVTGTVDGVDVAALNTTVGTKLANIVEDTSPQLGGDLDTNSNHILLNDTAQLKMGASNDFIIRHNGTDNTLGGNATTKFFNPLFEIFKLDGTKKAVSFNADSGQELYFNNSKKLETTSGGIAVTGGVEPTGHVKLDDDRFIYFGTGDDFIIGHQAGTPQNVFRSTDGATKMIFQGGSETMMVLHPQAQVELYFDNSNKFATTTNGVQIYGHIDMSDNKKIRLGGSQDLEIFHNGTDSRITDTGAGSLAIGGSAVFIQNAAHDENMIRALPDGAVDLYHNGSAKITTTSYGALFSDGKIIIDDGSTGHVFFDLNSVGLQIASGTTGFGAYKGIEYNASKHQFFFQGGLRQQLDNDGIKFNGDTAAANALDDFEQGTYTPNVQTNNGVNAGVSTAFGSYVKVGTLVTVHIGVTTNSHSGVDTSAQYRVYLPFTAANQSGVGTEGNLICSQWSIGSQNISWMGGEVQNGFNFIYMHYHNGSNNNTNNLTPSAASNELHFRGTCVYRTAS